MKRLILEPSPLNLGSTEVEVPISKNLTVKNTGDEITSIIDVSINKNCFNTTLALTLLDPDYPPNITIYLDADKSIADNSGIYHTSDLGYGSIGITDANGKLTIAPDGSSILITSINTGLNMELEGTFTEDIQYVASSDNKLVAISDSLATSRHVGYGNKQGFIDIDFGTITLVLASLTDKTLDTNFTGTGTSSKMANNNVTFYAKKNSQSWAEAVNLGFTTVEVTETFEKTDLQLPSVNFSIGDVINIKVIFNDNTNIESNIQTLTVV